MLSHSMCSNMSCFWSDSSPGGLLLSHRFPAEGVSCRAGHRRCDPVVAEFRKVSLWQWPSTEAVLLQTECRRCASQVPILQLSGYPQKGGQSCCATAVQRRIEQKTGQYLGVVEIVQDCCQIHYRSKVLGLVPF